MKKLSILFTLLIIACNLFAQNPFITTQYSADPTARVFEGRLYVYPSHDILATPGHGRVAWFCMEDYHVFSSANLHDWTDHGMIVSQNKVKWVDSTSYSMWAPDCIFRDGKYFFYFPARTKDTVYGRGSAIGVALADKPYGPFIPEPAPIKNVHGIDPCVFIDKDGQAYIYYAQGNIYMAKLKKNMLEIDGDPVIIKNLPEKGLKEGPFLFERKGTYYFTYPHVENKIERLEYATGPTPMGPFTFKGVIMDESASGCWTNHQSVVQFKDQWYLFYHNDDFSPKFDKARSIRVDSLFFEADGSIRKVIPTLRGVGITPAEEKIQIDRYSSISEKGTSISFLDTLNRFAGWKILFDASGAFAKYNRVDFKSKAWKSVQINAASNTGGDIQIHSNNSDGPVIAELSIPKNSDWHVYNVSLKNIPKGVQDICVTQKNDAHTEIDWIRFR